MTLIWEAPSWISAEILEMPVLWPSDLECEGARVSLCVPFALLELTSAELDRIRKLNTF